MPTLLLRLAGPMQSWGTRSRFTMRDTEREPSKSGVVGLLCAALGRPRHESVEDLAALRMGVRVDLEGTLRTDYHTAGAQYPRGIIQADGKRSYNPVVSQRDYLADADFLVGLEGDDVRLLEELEAALRRPYWQLSLGRKAFVPSVPVWIPGGGIRDLALEAALEREPWPRLGLPVATAERLAGWGRRRDAEAARIRFQFEVRGTTEGETRADQPSGAAFATRTFGLRRVAPDFKPLDRDGTGAEGMVPVRDERKQSVGE